MDPSGPLHGVQVLHEHRNSLLTSRNAFVSNDALNSYHNYDAE